MSGSLAALTSLRPTRPPPYLAFVAGGVPLAYYVASASAHGGLDEEGTFVAAARTLGIAHPPGAPLTTLLSSSVALLPVGSLSLRVSVASAVFAAILLGMFARALFFSLLGIGVRGERLAALLALAATWFTAQTPLFVAQATRPNVYTLQFALALIVIDALARFELSEPTDDRRTLYFAAFVQGLSFANHHVLALLMLSVAAPTLGRIFARRGFLGLMGHVAAPILGFSAYAYVPIRGGRFPDISIGNPSNLTRSLWVLSADPWWGPKELPEPDTLARLADGLAGRTPGIAGGVLVLAMTGFALGARTPSQRRFAALWLIALLVPLASVAWIIEPKLERDTWGALIPCALALVALAAFGVGLALSRLARAHEQAATRGALILAAAALAGLTLTAEQRGRARFVAPDALDDLARRELPPSSVVLTRSASRWFRHLGAEVEERLRPDVTLVPLAFLDYPRERERLAERIPELAPLLGETASDTPLPVSLVRNLAEKRPLLLELDRSVRPGLYPLLVSDGLLDRVSVQNPVLERELTRPREAARFARLYARVGQPVAPGELAARLARIHFHKALVAGTLGDRESATLHSRLALANAPEEPRLLRLSAALDGEVALDPTPFLTPEEAP